MFKCELFCVLLLNVLLAYARPWSFEDVNIEGVSPEFTGGTGSQYAAVKKSKNANFGSKGYADFLGFGTGSEGSYARDGHEGKYGEQGGVKKIKFDGDGHYLLRKRGGKGEKGLVYEEIGSYSKGHETVGSHVVHKLDEYKKDTDFYDENHAAGRKLRYGGYRKEEKGNAGDFQKVGHGNVGYGAKTFGRNGHFAKGSHFSDDAGHQLEFGKNKYFVDEANLDAKDGGEMFKNWKIGDYLL